VQATSAADSVKSSSKINSTKAARTFWVKGHLRNWVRVLTLAAGYRVATAGQLLFALWAWAYSTIPMVLFTFPSIPIHNCVTYSHFHIIPMDLFPFTLILIPAHYTCTTLASQLTGKKC